MTAGIASLATGSNPPTADSGTLDAFANTSKEFSTINDAGTVLNFVTGRVVPTSSPADPTGTTDTTGKMMGLAGSFTPAFNGRMLLIATGNIASSASADGAAAQLTYGTSTAPTNGAALTGTAVGSIVQITTANANASKYPFTCMALVTGLTVGTTYWLDLRVKAITAGTASVAAITLIAVEL